MTAVADLTCSDERRRAHARAAGLNGLDHLEVGADRRLLTVWFLLKAPPTISRDDVRIEGGRRIRDLQVVDVRMRRDDDPTRDDSMVVELDRPGDFSTYRLVVDVPGFDPRHAALDVSFTVDCPSELDCVPEPAAPAPAPQGPEISYLAKDYASFRQLLFDRLAVTMPAWREQHVPDLGVTLVELLAYVGDQLSYHQDAVATEAYLDTARQRISVRRHARLVDYRMHEGVNARTWVCVDTDTDLTLPADVSFVTGPTDPAGVVLDDTDPVATGPEVFVPVEPGERVVRATHGTIRLYTWSDARCCLPTGATGATLLDQADLPPDVLPAPDGGDGSYGDPYPDPYPYPDERAPRVLRLQPGDVLILEEVVGPRTGVAADADPTHRHPVRLTEVREDRDPVNGAQLLEVTWADADALPFPLCLSSVGPPPKCEELTDVSVARGNVVLADHGRWVRGEDLGSVPVAAEQVPCADAACGQAAVLTPGRFAPTLAGTPLTFSAPLPPADSAAALMAPPDARAALPALELTSTPQAPGGVDALFPPLHLVVPGELAARLADPVTVADHELRSLLSAAVRGLVDAWVDEAEAREQLAGALRDLRHRWSPVFDLLSSSPTDRHVVVEVDNDGRAHLRFGDGALGRRPAAHARFVADYRVGGGLAGNVGADTIIGIAWGTTVVRGARLRPRNPLPAWGGLAPETLASVKLRAPVAFRRELVRAVTADDYARLAERDPRVQRAAAALRFTGSATEVRVAVDARGGTAGPELLDDVAAALEPFRRIGHEVVVVPAVTVPLDVAVTVCVQPAYLRAHVLAAVNRVLGALFAPDALTFGDDVHLSRVVAAVVAVPGVENAEVTTLRRLLGGDDVTVDGVLPIGPLEVARLDRDPDAPENGRLVLTPVGGR